MGLRVEGLAFSDLRVLGVEGSQYLSPARQRPIKQKNTSAQQKPKSLNPNPTLPSTLKPTPNTLTTKLFHPKSLHHLQPQALGPKPQTPDPKRPKP